MFLNFQISHFFLRYRNGVFKKYSFSRKKVYLLYEKIGVHDYNSPNSLILFIS